jgi:hypothetical protein
MLVVATVYGHYVRSGVPTQGWFLLAQQVEVPSNIKYKSDADGYEEFDPDKMTNINLLPKVGYLVVDDLALGLGLNVALSIEKDGDDNDKYLQTLLSVEPFV